MLKKVLAATMCFAMAAGMTACGGSGDSGSGNSDSGEKGMTILTADDTTEGGALKAMAEKYQEETGIKVTMTEVPYGDMETKLLNMIKAGNAPAVVRYSGFAAYSDYLLDITDIAPSQDEMFLATEIDGKTLALAANATANGMVYNKTLFDQAGIIVPTSEEDLWTWDEFRDVLKTVIKNSDAEYGMVWDHSDNRYNTMLYQYGGSVYNEDMTECLVDSDISQKCMTDFVQMFEDGIMPKSTWAGTEDPQAMFKTGKVAVHMCGNWVMNDYLDNITDFEWAPMLMPKGETRATIAGGNYIYAVDGSGMEEEAKQFLQWFYDPENYAEYCKIGQYLPGRTGVEVEYEAEGMEIFQNELEATPAITQQLNEIGIKYPGSNPGQVYRECIDSVIAGQMTVDDAVTQIKTEICGAYEGMK